MTPIHRQTILIHGLRVSCVIGLFREERSSPREVLVDLQAELEPNDAASSEKIDNTVDYIDMGRVTTGLLQIGRFHLLESAAEALGAWFLATPHVAEQRAQVRSISVDIRKEGAWAQAQNVGVRVERAGLTAPQLCGPAVALQTVFASARTTISRVHVPAGERWRPVDDVHWIGLFALGQGLLFNGQPQAGNTVLSTCGQPVTVENVSDHDMLLACGVAR